MGVRKDVTTSDRDVAVVVTTVIVCICVVYFCLQTC